MLPKTPPMPVASVPSAPINTMDTSAMIQRILDQALALFISRQAGQIVVEKSYHLHHFRIP